MQILLNIEEHNYDPPCIYCRFFALLLIRPCSANSAEPVSTEGHVSAVTVYQGQALVTREVKIAETEGLLELVVTNLPESVLPGSLFAEPGDGIQIRSVRYRVRPIEEDVRQEVRELDEQIQTVNDKLAAVAQERGLLAERKQYLNQLGQFAAVTSREELRSGVLNAETLKDLTAFQFSEREGIAERESGTGPGRTDAQQGQRPAGPQARNHRCRFCPDRARSCGVYQRTKAHRFSDASQLSGWQCQLVAFL